MNQEHIWGYKPDGILIARGDYLRWRRDPSKAYIVSSVEFTGVKVDYWSGQDLFQYGELSEECEYSKDGGRTWYSCNKLQVKSDIDSDHTVQSKAIRDPANIEPTLFTVLLSWILCPLFFISTAMLAVPGGIVCVLEKRVNLFKWLSK